MTTITLHGRLPEIDLELSNGLHVLSMMTAEGDPEWGLIRREEGNYASVGVVAGKLHFDLQLDETIG